MYRNVCALCQNGRRVTESCTIWEERMQIKAPDYHFLCAAVYPFYFFLQKILNSGRGSNSLGDEGCSPPLEIRFFSDPPSF